LNVHVPLPGATCCTPSLAVRVNNAPLRNSRICGPVAPDQ
jgi:hypothetical protein